MDLISSIKRFKESDLVTKIGETFATRIVQLIVSLGTSVLLARALGPEGRGKFALAVTLCAVIVQIANLGLHSANTYYSARTHGGRINELIGNSFLISLVLIIPCLFLGLIFYLFEDQAPVTGWLLVLSLAAAPVGLFYMNLQNIIIGLQEVRPINITELTLNIFILIVLMFIVLIGFRSPVPMYATTITAQIFGVYLLFYWLHSVHSVKPRISLRLLKVTLHYGFKAYIATMFSFLVFRVDILMVNYYLGELETGLYAIAISLINVMYILPTVAGSLVFAKMCGLPTFNERVYLGVRYSLAVLAIMLIAVIAAVILCSFIIELLFGDEYAASADAFILLMPGVLAWSGESIIRKVLTSDGYHTGVVKNWAVAFIVNVILNVILIPEHGIQGAAIASSAAVTLVAILNIVLLFWEWRRNNA